MTNCDHDARIADLEARIVAATNVLDNWVGAINPNDYDRRFIQAMRRALNGGVA